MPRAKRQPVLPATDKPVRVAKPTQLSDPDELLNEIPLGDSPGPKPARKGNVELPSTTGLGSMAYSDSVMGPLFAQPIGKKQEKGRDKWANTALVLVHRAQKAAQTYGKKDFNSLYRLVLSAGIAYDKAFPTQVQPLGGNLVIQLFGSLGADTARRILEPARPLLSEKPLEGNQVSEAEIVEPLEGNDTDSTST